MLVTAFGLREVCERLTERGKVEACIIPNYATNSRSFRDNNLAVTFFPPTEARARTIEANFSVAAGEERTRYLESGISSASTGCRGGLKVSASTLTVTATSPVGANYSCLLKLPTVVTATFSQR
ncbi:hypothetical protein ANTQUA_LOCUS7732 [Anthophora quadrimaculata]